MKLKHARKGQLVMSEYVLLFFVVVASISAMTLFVQRALQARHRDAKMYAVDLAAQACEQVSIGGVDCMGAAGVNGFAYEYEPYYGESKANIGRKSADKKVIDGTGKWGKHFTERTEIGSTSAQLPPRKDN